MKLLQALNLIQFLFNNRFLCNASVFSFIKSPLTFLGLLPPRFQVNAPEQRHKPHDCHIPTAFSSGGHAGSAEVRGPLLSYSMQLLTLLSCPGSVVRGHGQRGRATWAACWLSCFLSTSSLIDFQNYITSNPDWHYLPVLVGKGEENCYWLCLQNKERGVVRPPVGPHGAQLQN